jgi:hypothetical protein
MPVKALLKLCDKLVASLRAKSRIASSTLVSTLGQWEMAKSGGDFGQIMTALLFGTRVHVRKLQISLRLEESLESLQDHTRPEGFIACQRSVQFEKQFSKDGALKNGA